jgi:DNA replication and repair protein RecF
MFHRIYLYNFRNLEKGSVLFNNKRIILTGSNGQGKTNLLEAIYYLCLGSSFKERHEENIAALGTNEFAVAGFFYDDDIEQKIVVSWREGKKVIKINDSVIKDRKELLVRFPCFILSYDDMRLAENEPERRRRFFDQSLSYSEDGYVDFLRRHKKIIKDKNSALKANNRELIKIYNKQLADIYIKVKQLREQFIDSFNKGLLLFLNTIGFNPMTIRVDCSLKDEESGTVEEYLNLKMDTEIKRGVSLYGIHRDRYLFLHNGLEIAGYYSTGQKRTLAIALKICSINMHTALGLAKPVVLVDDVFLELERRLKENIVTHIPDYEQIFFTFLSDDAFAESIGDAEVYRLKDGVFYVQ